MNLNSDFAKHMWDCEIKGVAETRVTNIKFCYKIHLAMGYIASYIIQYIYHLCYVYCTLYAFQQMLRCFVRILNPDAFIITLKQLNM